MRYVSTRGQSPAVPASTTILNGLAPDGGLYVPESLPALDLTALQGLSYRARAEKILSLFLTDFPAADLHDCVESAYTAEKFGGQDPAPLHALSGDRHLLELWHGPTCAFKDMALQILPHLLAKSLKIQGETRRAVILVATSGDTGKAALEGFCNAPGTAILVFYPGDGVSEIQKRQMITQRGENVGVCGIQGNFDDAQTGVKALFSDPAVQKKMEKAHAFLSSANSINFGRLVPQIVYYVHAYLTLVEQGRIALGDPIRVCVPTGNFGNILAAFMAARMGLPIERFVCASNENDVLTEFIQTGRYNRVRPFHTTISPSMDILISSNLERLLWYLTDQNTTRVAAWMKQLKETGEYRITGAPFSLLSGLFEAASLNEEETAAAIRKTEETDHTVIDPHTAVAVGALEKVAPADCPTVIASTASPFKFTRAVLSALGEQGSEDPFEELSLLEKKAGKAPRSLSELKSLPVRFPQVVGKTEMESVLESFVQK